MNDLIDRLRNPEFHAYPAHGSGMVSLVTSQNMADMKEAAAEIERLRAALYKIAAFDDKGASERLEKTGSLSSFDEPGSVKMARDALRGYQPPIINDKT